MVPTCGLGGAQVNTLLEFPVTKAVNCCRPPRNMVTVAGETLIVTSGTRLICAVNVCAGLTTDVAVIAAVCGESMIAGAV